MPNIIQLAFDATNVTQLDSIADSYPGIEVLPDFDLVLVLVNVDDIVLGEEAVAIIIKGQFARPSVQQNLLLDVTAIQSKRPVYLIGYTTTQQRANERSIADLNLGLLCPLHRY